MSEEEQEVIEKLKDNFILTTSEQNKLANLIDRLQKENEAVTYNFEKTVDKLEIAEKENKELNLENQALYESINLNDDNMLVRRYEKLQKELEQAISIKQIKIDTAKEVLKWKGKYHLLSRKIKGE